MPEQDAFTGGVKPGGLTNGTQIRLLLCYLLRCAGPLTREEIETSLLGEQLVNYFELSSGLEELMRRKLASRSGAGYSVTEKGAKVAQELEEDLPRSVREAAVCAAVRAQAWTKKSAEYHAEIQETKRGYSILCSIRGIDREDFSLQFMMPDRPTAEMVRQRFILHGNEVYRALLQNLTEPRSEDADGG